MTWPGFPKRLQSALKALCCLAQTGMEMQSSAIAGQIGVPKAETAKILQLLVWGGFVTSRRGTKGGFHLASAAEEITMGEVIRFFLARHEQDTDDKSPVMRALHVTLAAGQQKFSKLTLAEVANFPLPRKNSRQARRTQTRLLSPKLPNSSIRKAKRRSRSNAAI